MQITKSTAADLLPLLRRAVSAQVELYNALRSIEMEIFDGTDIDGLDDCIKGLAFNLDVPEDAETAITLEDAEKLMELAKTETRCPKCGTAHNSTDYEDEGEGEEEGRIFRYCSERCLKSH